MAYRRALLYRVMARRRLAAQLGRLAAPVLDPVFVVGSGRCGSTVLCAILESSPDLAVFPGEGNDLWHPTQYPYLTHEQSGPPILAAPVAFSALSRAQWTPEHRRHLVRTVSAMRTLRPGRPVIVKSAMVSHMVTDLLEVFPEARFVHIYRYGPAVVDSLVKKNQALLDWFGDEAAMQIACASYWCSCVEELLAQQSRMASARWHTVDYEALCSDSDATVDALAAFLGTPAGLFQRSGVTMRPADWRVSSATGRMSAAALEAMEPMLARLGYA